MAAELSGGDVPGGDGPPEDRPPGDGPAGDGPPVAAPEGRATAEREAGPAERPGRERGRGGDPWDPSRPGAPRAERRRLTHVDRVGRPRMVDVSEKPATARRAVAEAEVALSQETLSLIIDGQTPKGDVLSVAELAGVMAGKRTSELIPLCHPIGLTDLVVRAVPDRASSSIRIQAEAATIGPTGVEMEALTAASVAALTVYDMVKGVERGVSIRSVRLLSKSGGRSGEWQRPAEAAPAAPPAQRGVRSAGRLPPRRRG